MFLPSKIPSRRVSFTGRFLCKDSFPGSFNPRKIPSCEDYIPGRFVPGKFASQISFLGRFLPGEFLSQKDCFPGRKLTGKFPSQEKGSFPISFFPRKIASHEDPFPEKSPCREDCFPENLQPPWHVAVVGKESFRKVSFSGTFPPGKFPSRPLRHAKDVAMVGKETSRTLPVIPHDEERGTGPPNGGPSRWSTSLQQPCQRQLQPPPPPRAQQRETTRTHSMSHGRPSGPQSARAQAALWKVCAQGHPAMWSAVERGAPLTGSPRLRQSVALNALFGQA